MESIDLKSAWQAESIRLIEAKKGFYADDVYIKKLSNTDNSFAKKIADRADHLAEQQGVKELINTFINSSKLILFGIVFLAVIFAGLSAKTTLGDNQTSVNIFTVLVAFLGVHILTFVLWLFSYAFGHQDNSYGLGAFWIWLSTKFKSKDNSHLVSQALVSTLARQNAFKPLLGCVTNGLWLVMLVVACLSMLALFSTKSYTFHWETTILSPQFFVGITSWLSWLPQALGFNVPDAGLIELSSISNEQSFAGAAMWSQWLIAVVLIYGVFLRLFAFIAMLVIFRLRIKTLHIDENLIGYAELFNKLMPLSKGGILDAPAPDYIIGGDTVSKSKPTVIGNNAIIAIEMPHIEEWPPFTLPIDITDIGIVDSSLQRKQAIDFLVNTTPKKLLIMVDVMQTPDRGSIRLVLELMQLSQQSIVLLLDTKQALNQSLSMEEVWFSYLQKAEINKKNIFNNVELARQWLID